MEKEETKKSTLRERMESGGLGVKITQERFEEIKIERQKREEEMHEIIRKESKK